MVEARQGPDGRFRVPWYRAWRLTHFTTVVDPATGERLFPDRKTLSLIGGLAGAVTAPIIIGNYYVWMYAYGQEFGAQILGLTILLVLSIFAAASVIASVHVTFTRAPKPGPPGATH